jgi:serine/threonine protein phosphatase PrpC
MDKDYTKAIKSALEEEEALLLEEYDSGQDENAFSGSTVAICLVDLSSGILTTGNLGDSHVILGEAEGSSDAKQVKTVCIISCWSYYPK